MKIASHLRTNSSQWRVIFRGVPLGIKFEKDKKRWKWSGNRFDFFVLFQLGHQNFYLGYFK